MRTVADSDATPTTSERDVRAFRVVYTLLTLHFGSLAAVYLVDPEFAVRQFSRVNTWLGGVEFAPPEVTAWRYATVCGMATLAVMTFMMTVDLRRNYSMLVPVAFFKILNAVLWFWYTATNTDLRVFALAGVYDLLVVVVMIWLARRAAGADSRLAPMSR